MSEQARSRLKKAIDLLESNVWLELDEMSFPRFFDGPLHPGSIQLQDAKAFAEANGAVCIFLTNPRVVKFGRAYIKRGEDD